MSRFELKNEAGDTWVLTDTVSGISLRFKEHELNETQQASIPESFPADPVRASRIMQAMGIKSANARNAVRLSFSNDTTEEDAEYLASVLKELC